MPFSPQQQSGAKAAVNAIVLIVLVVVLVFVLVWTGVMKCGTVPGLCDAYYAVFGQPKVLIAFGNSGLGNPELLKLAMADPARLGVRAQLTHVSQLNTGNLKDYQLVIVEKARAMSTKQMQMFIDYANTGGRLVWTGDAGAELDSSAGDELLYTDEVPGGDSNKHSAISPWARKQFGLTVRLDSVLGVDYVANFCEIKRCTGSETFAGNLQAEPTASDPLIYGIAPNLKLYASQGKDFAIVRENSLAVGRRVLSLNYSGGSSLDANGTNYGSTFPMIVSSGLGGKAVYYAMPPEGFVEEGKPQKYYSFITNLYYAMFR